MIDVGQNTHDLLFPGEEGVALQTLAPVDGNEGKHVGEGGVR